MKYAIRNICITLMGLVVIVLVIGGGLWVSVQVGHMIYVVLFHGLVDTVFWEGFVGMVTIMCAGIICAAGSSVGNAIYDRWRIRHE